MAFRWNDLTVKEREIARLVGKGELKYHAIAQKIGLSRRGLINVTQVIYRILGVENQVQLALLLGRHYNEAFKTDILA